MSSDNNELLKEIKRLNKVNEALMKQVEKSMDSQGDAYSIFQTNIVLEDKVKERTASLKKTEKDLVLKNKELVKVNLNLELEKMAAETANIAKSTFLANISHELRTPMHGILSFARYGLNDLDNGDQDLAYESFVEIRDCAERLMKLINDLLDLSKLEAGKMVYHIEESSLNSDIDIIFNELGLIAKEKNCKLSFDDGQDFIVECDSHKIQQVIRNLTSNAIKFSLNNEKVKVELFDRGAEIMFKISNKGPSIPQSELQSVFDKFIQSTKTNDGSGGTGLGLSISRQIILDHNGEIWAENNDEGRVSFYFTLPKKHCSMAA